MPVNFSDFSSSPTISDTDQIVGYAIPHAAGERRWSFSTLSNTVRNNVITTINNTLSQSLTGTTGMYRVRKLADSIMNQNYVGAAVTIDEEVIIWGNLDTYQTGHYWYTVAATPDNAIAIPFLDGPNNSSLDSRTRVVNLKRENKTILQLHHAWLQTMVLVSDGTVWSRAYTQTAYAPGWSAAELTNTVIKYPTALYRITQWDWTNPARANKIVDIQLLPVEGENTFATWGALDDAGDFHLWGYMNPFWGGADRYATPQNLTKGTALQGRIVQFQISGLNGYRSVQVVTNTNEIWSFGYNGYGQLGNDTTTNQTTWVRAQAAATPTSTTKAPISNVLKLVKQRNTNYTNFGYISRVSGTQNTLFVSGWENDTYSVKSTASTNNVYIAATNGTSPVNDLIEEAVMNGRSGYPGIIYRTASGRVFAGGTNSWGELGVASTTPGPTFTEVDVIHPVTGAKVKFGSSSGLIATQIITGDADNANATGILATDSAGLAGFKYLFLTGYRTLVNFDDFAQSLFVFTPISLKESVEEVLFGFDRQNHQFTFIRCAGGRVYGLGYSASGNIQNYNGWVSLPQPIF
jgi:hypothetical protein